MHYTGANSYLFVNGTKIIKFKAKNSEFVAISLYLGNISKDSSVDNMRKTGLSGYVHDFSVDYDAIRVDDILDIHKYLMKKKKNIKCLNLLKVLFAGLTILSSVNVLAVTALRCISMINEECKVRPGIVSVNSNEPVFYPFSIKTSQCNGSCNNINVRKSVFLML